MIVSMVMKNKARWFGRRPDKESVQAAKPLHAMQKNRMPITSTTFQVEEPPEMAGSGTIHGKRRHHREHFAGGSATVQAPDILFVSRWFQLSSAARSVPASQ